MNSTSVTAFGCYTMLLINTNHNYSVSPNKKNNVRSAWRPVSGSNKKLSCCWETVRRESMPRIAEVNVEMTT